MPAQSWDSLMKSANEASKEFAPLEPGIYNFVIKDPAKVKQTSKGLPKFTINPSVESGPRANARVFHDFNVVENGFALKRFFFDDLEKLGLGPDFFSTNPSGEQVASALQGKRFTAEVYKEQGSDGKEYTRLRNFAPATGAAPAAVGQVGVPGGLPAATPVATPQAAPAPQQAAQAPAPAAQPAQQAAPASPWDNATQAAPAAAPQGATIPIPNPFG